MKTALIIALICLIVGAILVGLSWALSGELSFKNNTVKDSVYPYGMDKLPTKIDITTVSSRVEILPVEGDEWRVECKDIENIYHTVELTDGILTIKQEGTTRKWYELISWRGIQNLSVTVYLPKQAYESLAISAVSGSIKVQEGFTFSNANLENESGSITCASRVEGALNVKNTSGSITVRGSVGGDLNVKNTSGSIHVLGGVDGALDITGGSGSIEVKNATPTRVNIKNISGGIDLINIVCDGECNVDNVSGSIELDRCDAASFDLHTVSGGIRGSILSAKVFDCHSISGGVHVPQNSEGGAFRARSTSGGIRVTIV